MIKSVSKAMNILTILSDYGESPAPLSEIAEKAGLNKSTCAHIIDTMCDEFYVERVSRKDGYRLGPWAYMLSRYGSYYNTLRQLSDPVLKWLHRQLNTSVFLAVVCNGRKYIISHIDPDCILPMSDGSMIQGYMESTATGLLLMAYMDEESLHYALSKRPPGIRNFENEAELQKALKVIRTQEYAYASDPSKDDCSYAFRITIGLKTIASLGILYPGALESAEYRKKVIRTGKTAAKEISRRMELNE